MESFIFLNESRPRICLEFSSNFSQTNNRFVIKFILDFSSLIEQFAGNLEFFTIKKKKKKGRNILNSRQIEINLSGTRIGGNV